MFGLNHIRFDASHYAILYQQGKVIKEGPGLSFFYFSAKSSLVSIPVNSHDLSFNFVETTQDFQTIRLEGEITYQVALPHQLASVLDFTIDPSGSYKSTDPKKVSRWIHNEIQTILSEIVRKITLKEAIHSHEALGKVLEQRLVNSRTVSLLGLSILNTKILEVVPPQDMAKLLEAEAREALKRAAEQAAYERRCVTIEQEVELKERELAAEEKQKKIEELRIEIARIRRENERKLKMQRIESDIKKGKIYRAKAS